MNCLRIEIVNVTVRTFERVNPIFVTVRHKRVEPNIVPDWDEFFMVANELNVVNQIMPVGIDEFGVNPHPIKRVESETGIGDVVGLNVRREEEFYRFGKVNSKLNRIFPLDSEAEFTKKVSDRVNSSPEVSSFTSAIL